MSNINIILPNNNFTLQNVLQLIRDKIKSGSKVIELCGFFQFHSYEYSQYKNLFFESFKFNALISNQIRDSLKKINIDTKEIISIHIRQGDYSTYYKNEFFWLTSMDSIFESIDNFKLINHKNNILYVSSDDLIYCKNEFEKNNLHPIYSDNLFTFENESLRLLVDFYLMSISNSNIISNSTLSFFASMLNLNSRIFLRPSSSKNVLIPYDPWNSQVLLSKAYEKI